MKEQAIPQELNSEAFDIAVSTEAALDLSGNRASARKGPAKQLATGLTLVLFALVWCVGMRVILYRDASSLAVKSVQHAQTVFQAGRLNAQYRLRTECQLLSEDPRLKSTLATQGVDANTIQDVLTDLKQLSSADFIAVLSPSGRVRAVAGQKSLAGQDLSGGSLIRGDSGNEQDNPATGTATWVNGNQLMDVSAHPLRFGNQLIGHLVLGSTVTDSALGEVFAATGVNSAVFIEGLAVQSKWGDGTLSVDAAKVALKGGTTPMEAQVIKLAGTPYAARILEAGDVMPRAYAVFISPVAGAVEHFDLLVGLSWLPGLVAVIFGLWTLLRGH